MESGGLRKSRGRARKDAPACGEKYNAHFPLKKNPKPNKQKKPQDSVVRLSGVSANYYDNRYWTLWKLPMFGCTDATQVLREIEAATKAFPDAYIRMAAFDAVRQVQVASMLVHRPASNNDYRKPNERQV